MLYNPNLEEIKHRMTAYWEREALERCCVSITVNKPDYQSIGRHNFYYDAEGADKRARYNFEHQYRFGETLAFHFPYFGTSIAEYLGCKANRVPLTTWFDHWMADEPDISQIGFLRPDIYQKQRETIARMLELSGDDYMVTVSDNAGLVDALAEVRGPEDLLVDMLTAPAFVEESVQRLLPIYKQTQEELFSLVQDNNQGHAILWQLWAPKRLAQMQCDLSVMISNEMFNRFVMPELEELTSFLDYPLYHMDGMEQIRHLDSILSLKNLRAIQWSKVDGQPRSVEFIPVFQKMQKAGKCLVMKVEARDVEKLLDNLSCRGLQLIILGIETPEEASKMMKLVEKHSKDRG